MSKSISAPIFYLLHDHKTSLKEGICGSLHFSKFPAFSQIRKALRKLPSALVKSQMSLSSKWSLCQSGIFRAGIFWSIHSRVAGTFWLSKVGPCAYHSWGYRNEGMVTTGRIWTIETEQDGCEIWRDASPEERMVAQRRHTSIPAGKAEVQSMAGRIFTSSSIAKQNMWDIARLYLGLWNLCVEKMKDERIRDLRIGNRFENNGRKWESELIREHGRFSGGRRKVVD